MRGFWCLFLSLNAQRSLYRKIFTFLFYINCLFQGNILYRFPSLQRTATPQRSGRKEYVGKRWTDWVGQVERFLQEKKWQFRYHIICLNCWYIWISYLWIWVLNHECLQCSKTSSSERALVIGLGGLNLFGVIVLGTMLK